MDCDTIYNRATVEGVKAITDALELSAQPPKNKNTKVVYIFLDFYYTVKF